MGRHVRGPALPDACPDPTPPAVAPSPANRRQLTDDRRAQGLRTARVTKLVVAATFVAVFVCTPEVLTAMTKGFTTIFAGQGIADVSPAQVPQPGSQPDSQPSPQP